MVATLFCKLFPWPLWHHCLLDFLHSSLDNFFQFLQVFFFLNLVHIHWYILGFCHWGSDTLTFCSVFSNLTVIFVLNYHLSLSKPKSMSSPDVQLLTEYLCVKISNIPQIWYEWTQFFLPTCSLRPLIYDVSLNCTLIHSFTKAQNLGVFLYHTISPVLTYSQSPSQFYLLNNF